MGEVNGATPGLSWSAVKARRTNTTTSCRVVMDGEAADEAARLGRELERLEAIDKAGHGDDALHDRIREVAGQVQAAEAAAAETEVTFVFQAVGQGRYNRLKADHPLPPELKGKVPEGLDYNPVTFPPMLMALSCVSPPELHAEVDGDGKPDPAVLAEWGEIHDTYSPGLNARLWSTALSAHIGVNQVPKSRLASQILSPPGSGSS